MSVLNKAFRPTAPFRIYKEESRYVLVRIPLRSAAGGDRGNRFLEAESDDRAELMARRDRCTTDYSDYLWEVVLRPDGTDIWGVLMGGGVVQN